MVQGIAGDKPLSETMAAQFIYVSRGFNMLMVIPKERYMRLKKTLEV